MDATPPLLSRRAAIATAAAAVGTLAHPATAATAPQAIVFVGPSNHPPGTHEVAAGGRLLVHCLTAAGLTAEVRTEWPADGKTAFATVSTIVFIGDLFPGAVLPNGETVMKDLAVMMQRGCGLVCLHYATGLEAKHVAADGDHPLLRWIGGYFATRCQHHQSIAKVFAKATIEPTPGEHPLTRGWKPFTIHDEPYINNYFGKTGLSQPAIAFATSQLPPEKPQPQVVGWATERPDGGRGAGIVMPHFYKNWKNDDLRTLILNAIVWTAKRDVPASGVQVPLTDLAAFQPASLEPQPRKK